MKLQCGLIHWDGQPAGCEDFVLLYGEGHVDDADVSGQVFDGPAMMVYRGNRITCEEDTETQPLSSGNYILTWDGRLDNREELACRLGLRVLESIPDPNIVLKAYQTFGGSVLSDLIGEFALVLWCKTTRSLTFARSACGARTLYYVAKKNTLVWSSNFAELVRRTGVDLTVSDTYILEYLLSQPSARHSPLSNVGVVPPNTAIRCENGRVQAEWKLWNPASRVAVRHCSDQEYEEQCREKLTQAVRVRLRAKHPVFCELSGGLDSSSLVLIADQILLANNQPIGSLKTVSCVYEQSQTCDEQHFIRAVEGHRGSQTLTVHEEDQRTTLGLEDPEFTGLPNPLHLFPGRYATVAAIMREHNARVLLTGRGGDHLFWSEPDGSALVADELRRFHLVRAGRQCRTWSRFAGIPFYQLLYRALALAMWGPFCRFSQYKRTQIPEWLARPYRTDLNDTVLDANPQAHSPSAKAQIFILDRLFHDLAAGFFSEYSGMYVSHPYTHRPLVEFCMGVPLSQFLREGQTRSLMRRALAQLLPRTTVRRASKGVVDEAILRALQKERSQISDVTRWEVCERGYADRRHLSDELRAAQSGLFPTNGSLFRLLSLERWLRSLRHIGRNPQTLDFAARWTLNFWPFGSYERDPLRSSHPAPKSSL